MGQSPSSMRSRSRTRSFRGFMRRSKLNKSSLSHTFSLPPSEEYPELMNVNTATEEQLMTLPGVSRQLAQEIVRHRQMIGRFKRVDDLALVSGIGAEKLELLRPEICTNSRRQISRASSCTHSLDSIRGSSENKLCSVNYCSVFQLQCVPGLNQELAANIVDYRNKKGPFKSLDDLIKVRGMGIVRLSTIKPHLSLEPRKCESVQQLSNGHANGWSDYAIKELSNFKPVSSTPKSPHRKSLSMPTTLPALPNGFATAPVNDILELLTAYSHRPIVEKVFTYERDGVRCRRIASWNLHQLSIDKITNPGVREVVCRTILENKFSIIAIQDIQDEAALKIICDELNTPVLRRVKDWKQNSHRWDYCISEKFHNQSLGFLFESSNRGVSIEDVDLDQVRLLTDTDEVGRLVATLDTMTSGSLLAAPQAFVVSSRPFIVVNLYCQEALTADDVTKVQQAAKLATSVGINLCFVGEFGTWQNVQALAACESLLPEDACTVVDDKTPGRSGILAPTPHSLIFNGEAASIRSGLSHLAIPRGWSWGGPASPHCPVYAEFKLPD